MRDSGAKGASYFNDKIKNHELTWLGLENADSLTCGISRQWVRTFIATEKSPGGLLNPLVVY